MDGECDGGRDFELLLPRLSHGGRKRRQAWPADWHRRLIASAEGILARYQAQVFSQVGQASGLSSGKPEACPTRTTPGSLYRCFRNASPRNPARNLYKKTGA